MTFVSRGILWLVHGGEVRHFIRQGEEDSSQTATRPETSIGGPSRQTSRCVASGADLDQEMRRSGLEEDLVKSLIRPGSAHNDPHWSIFRMALSSG